MTPPRPLWKSVQDYVLIAIGMISYAIGWNVFLLPTNVTASGLPGISSIIYWATGCPVQIPYFIVNATLLICAFKISEQCTIQDIRLGTVRGSSISMDDISTHKGNLYIAIHAALQESITINSGMLSNQYSIAWKGF